jgi:hypothetical protein
LRRNGGRKRKKNGGRKKRKNGKRRNGRIRQNLS